MTNLMEQWQLATTQFHWLRPTSLLLLIPLLFIAILLWRQKRFAVQWQEMIAPELLPYLLDGETLRPKKFLLWGLASLWLIATLAIAGPSWTKRPTPVEKNQQALVILLDLSSSMISEDIKPSRLVRARLKITDILRERKDGQTALVVYAGEAHTVTPLSDDSATMISLLPSLHPGIMPLQGSNTEDAVARGLQLLHDAGANHGQLLLITDGVVPEAFGKIRSLLSGTHIPLNILGVGTQTPAPVPSGNGGFVHDSHGAIVTTQLNSAELKSLAESVHGHYRDIANNDSDIRDLLTNTQPEEKQKPTLERDFDQWFDEGHWLVLLLLPGILFCFRRGVLLSLFFCAGVLTLTPEPSYAWSLDDLWQTKDQQAAHELQQGNAKAAAATFNNPDWKAAAEYRAGNYAAAANAYAQQNTAGANYNRGNALAKQGKLEDAIKAYDAALKQDPTLTDATKNRELVEKLLKQKQQQKNSSDKNQQDNKNQQDKKNQKDNKDQQDQNKDSQQNKQDKDNQQDNKDTQKDNQQQSSAQQSSAQNQSEQNAEQNNSSANSNQSAAAQHQSSAQASSSAAEQAQPSSGASSSSGNSSSVADQAKPAYSDNNLTPEQKQALEQWLRRVPDDPGGLLRNKFKWQYLQNRQKKLDGEFEGPENKADQRW